LERLEHERAEAQKPTRSDNVRTIPEASDGLLIRRLSKNDFERSPSFLGFRVSQGSNDLETYKLLVRFPCLLVLDYIGGVLLPPVSHLALRVLTRKDTTAFQTII
jgi:hypothetical protein